MTAPSAPQRGHLILVIILGLLWGFNWPIVKIALGEFGPWTMRAVSLVGASSFLVLASLVSGGSLKVPLRQWWRVVLPGTIGIAGVNILNAFAQMHMSTGRTAIIAFSMPIWATLLALVVLDERLDRRKVMGLVLGAAGLVCLGWPIIAAGTWSLGLTLAFASAIAWASAVVFMKRFPVSAAPMTAATWQLACGAFCLSLGMLAFEQPLVMFKGFTPGVGALIYNTFLAQAFGTWLWFRVLGRTSAGIAAISTLMVPAVGVIGAVILLGERPALTDWLGLALVIAASASVLIPPMRRPFRKKSAITPQRQPLGATAK